MNEVQINKIKKRADEYATSYFPYEKQFLEREAVVKCCVHVVTETIWEEPYWDFKIVKETE